MTRKSSARKNRKRGAGGAGPDRRSERRGAGRRRVGKRGLGRRSPGSPLVPKTARKMAEDLLEEVVEKEEPGHVAGERPDREQPRPIVAPDPRPGAKGPNLTPGTGT